MYKSRLNISFIVLVMLMGGDSFAAEAIPVQQIVGASGSSSAPPSVQTPSSPAVTTLNPQASAANLPTAAPNSSITTPPIPTPGATTVPTVVPTPTPGATTVPTVVPTPTQEQGANSIAKILSDVQEKKLDIKITLSGNGNVSGKIVGTADDALLIKENDTSDTVSVVNKSAIAVLNVPASVLLAQ